MQDNQRQPPETRLGGTLRFNGGRIIGDRAIPTASSAEAAMKLRAEPRQPIFIVPHSDPL